LYLAPCTCSEDDADVVVVVVHDDDDIDNDVIERRRRILMKLYLNIQNIAVFCKLISFQFSVQPPS
jgi:hypothetical protein